MKETPSSQSTSARSQRRFNYQLRQHTPGRAIDTLFFIFASALAAAFAWHLLTLPSGLGWWLAVLIPFWVVVAYLVLPRVHQLMTSLYVPDYFLGRSRTSDGVLGDPVNLAFHGTAAQIHRAMTRAGWVLADPVTLRSSWRIVVASVLRRSYPEAPVSPLYLFHRKQDLAYQQESAGNPAQRHHVRFWRCPDKWPLPGGHRVGWLAAGSYDTAVGVSFFTLQITHRIDENIDIERDYIVDTLTSSSEGDVEVKIVEDFSTSYHHRNGGGDLIRTDGNLPVVDLRAVEDSLADAPPQVLEAARGFDTLKGFRASPDPGVNPTPPTSRREAAQASPNSLKLALAFVLVSVVAQATLILWALITDAQLPAAIFGIEGLRAPVDERDAALVSMALTMVLMSILAGLTLARYQLPRVLLMALLCIAVIGDLSIGAELTDLALIMHLLITSSNLVALLYLSSESVRAWSRRGRKRSKPGEGNSAGHGAA